MMNIEDNMETKPNIGDGGGGQNSVDQASISSFYPLPPMRYIKQFTDNNVRNKCTPIPPKPFVNGSYMMFGQNITIDDMIIRSLESQGLRRLYPREYDHKRELKKINASILVNFLDLIDLLIRCPDTQKREEKCHDLQLLFITIHHLINELRPHQARESIRVCLKMQKEQRQETRSRLLKQIERVQDIIRSAISNIKDKDISTLLQETLPESLPTTSTNIKTELANESSTLKNVDGNQSEDNLNKVPVSSVTKMTEMDAFMCDLVDEAF